MSPFMRRRRSSLVYSIVYTAYSIVYSLSLYVSVVNNAQLVARQACLGFPTLYVWYSYVITSINRAA